MAIQDNASLALIPSGYKSGKLYSVIPDSGNGDFTHTRGSTATRVNAAGLIETMASGVPRLDYPLVNGVVQSCPALLLEPSRTNLLKRSEDLSTTWSTASASVTTNTHVSPDGNTTADTLTVTGSSGSVYQDNITVTASTDYTFTFYVKRGTVASNETALAIRDQSGAAFIDQNIAYTAETDKWTRIEHTFTTPVGCTSVRVYPQRKTGGGIGTIFLWGFQLEQGDYATSYIPTTTASVTRSADECNGAGTSAEFNDSEGVFFAEIASLGAGSVRRFAIDNNASPINLVRLEYSSTTNRVFGVIYNGSSQIALSTYLTDELEFNKVAFKYKSGDFALWVNGVEVATSSSTFTMPTGLKTLGFDDGSGGNDFYSKTKQVMVFKTALSDSDLATLTS